MLSITGGPGCTSTVAESVTLPAELLTNSHTVCLPSASKVVVNIGAAPLEFPPIHSHSSGSPPDSCAVQVTLSPTLGRGGEQLTLSIVGPSPPSSTAVTCADAVPGA